jgi:hypothetical protein
VKDGRSCAGGCRWERPGGPTVRHASMRVVSRTRPTWVPSRYPAGRPIP